MHAAAMLPLSISAASTLTWRMHAASTLTWRIITAMIAISCRSSASSTPEPTPAPTTSEPTSSVPSLAPTPFPTTTTTATTTASTTASTTPTTTFSTSATTTAAPPHFFTLVNADTQLTIGTIENGDSFDINDLGTNQLSIQAQIAPVGVRKVTFSLDGSINIHSEGATPYSLLGDIGLDVVPWTAEVGTHAVTAVIDWNDDYDYDDYDRPRNDRASSVFAVFTITDRLSTSATTTQTTTPTTTATSSGTPEPCSDGCVDDVQPWSVKCSAAPCVGCTQCNDDDDGSGAFGESSGDMAATTLMPSSTTPAPTRAARLMLVDADTQADIMPLTNGAVIDLEHIGTDRLTIQLETSNRSPVVFGFDGNLQHQMASEPPYLLNGRIGDAFAPWTATLGAHAVTASIGPVNHLQQNQADDAYAGASAGSSLVAEVLFAGFFVVDSRTTSMSTSVTTTATTTITSTATTQPKPVALVLVNALSMEDIADLPLTDHNNDYDDDEYYDDDSFSDSAAAVVNVLQIGTDRLSVRADVNIPGDEGAAAAVRFGLDGNLYHRTERVPPYLLNGDDGGRYFPWTAALGLHSVTATVMDDLGNTLSFAEAVFVVVDDPSTTPTTTPTTTPLTTPQLPWGYRRRLACSGCGCDGRLPHVADRRRHRRCLRTPSRPAPRYSRRTTRK